jgi:uncharacterized protein (DUF362 family)
MAVQFPKEAFLSEKRVTGRREFLKAGVAGAVVLGASDALAFAAALETPKSRVVIARDAMLRGSASTVDAMRMSALLDRAMQTSLGTKDALAAWKQLVRPGQVVGLKVNTIAGHGLSTNVTLVEAITERLQQAGIKPYDIVIWDRTGNELERAGFPLSSAAGKVRCIGTDAVGYEQTPEKFGSVSSRLSKILTQTCDVVINLPLLKDHVSSGVTLSMKNMYGVIDNPSHYHGGGCNPGVADVNMLPSIRKKVRFTIGDATSACYHGGPGYKPEYVWHADSLIVGSDPVALDFTAWQIIESKRAEKGLKPLEAEGRLPRYIATAADARHQLGTNDPKRITLVEV